MTHNQRTPLPPRPAGEASDSEEPRRAGPQLKTTLCGPIAASPLRLRVHLWCPENPSRVQVSWSGVPARPNSAPFRSSLESGQDLSTSLREAEVMHSWATCGSQSPFSKARRALHPDEQYLCSSVPPR